MRSVSKRLCVLAHLILTFVIATTLTAAQPCDVWIDNEVPVTDFDLHYGNMPGGTVVCLYPGAYTQCGSKPLANYTGYGITLRGSGINSTFIRCQGRRLIVNTQNTKDAVGRVENMTVSGFNIADAPYSGGAIYSASPLTIQSVKFVNSNIHTGSGGCVYVRTTAGPLQVYDSEFVGCSCTGDGGAVYARASNGVDVVNTAVTDASAGGDAVIYLTEFTELAGNSIVKIIANHEGGVTIADAEVFGSIALGGGLVSINGTHPLARITVYAMTCSDNTAGGNGGCLRIRSSCSEVDLHGVVASYNVAGGNGGAIFLTTSHDTGTVVIRDSQLSYNEAYGQSGSIHADASVALVAVYDSQLIANTASGGLEMSLADHINQPTIAVFNATRVSNPFVPAKFFLRDTIQMRYMYICETHDPFDCGITGDVNSLVGGCGYVAPPCCDENAIVGYVLDGNYTCTCRAGYEGDGYTCNPVTTSATSSTTSATTTTSSPTSSTSATNTSSATASSSSSSSSVSGSTTAPSNSTTSTTNESGSGSGSGSGNTSSSTTTAPATSGGSATTSSSQTSSSTTTTSSASGSETTATATTTTTTTTTTTSVSPTTPTSTPTTTPTTTPTSTTTDTNNDDSGGGGGGNTGNNQIQDSGNGTGGSIGGLSPGAFFGAVGGGVAVLCICIAALAVFVVRRRSGGGRGGGGSDTHSKLGGDEEGSENKPFDAIGSSTPTTTPNSAYGASSGGSDRVSMPNSQQETTFTVSTLGSGELDSRSFEPTKKVGAVHHAPPPGHRGSAAEHSSVGSDGSLFLSVTRVIAPASLNNSSGEVRTGVSAAAVTDTAPSVEGLGPAEVIGRGGQATVYRALCYELGKSVVLKVFHTAAAYEREQAIITAAGEHPNLVQVLSLPHLPPSIIALELAAHGSLTDYIDSVGGSVDTATVVRVALGVARGLAHLHSVGVCHLDVKPDNVLLKTGDDGSLVALITDFGASFVVGRGDLRVDQCTVRYSAPEIIQVYKDHSAGSRILSYAGLDVYSFGMLLWELSTGLKPFAALTAEEIINAVCTDPSLRVDVRAVSCGALVSVVELCLSPAQSRPESLNAVIGQLEGVLSSL